MKFIAFDLETTGMKAVENKIIEIGAVRFDGSRALKGYGMLIDPGMAIPPDASAVNGITNEMVRGKPKITDVLPTFVDFCGDLPLVAHNAPFDYKFLLEEIKRYRVATPLGIVLDTLSLARNVFPSLPNYKLWTLTRYFNFPEGIFHRAEADSFHCGLLFSKIVETLKIRGYPCSEQDLTKLMGEKEVMRFPQFASKSIQLDLF